MNRDCSWTNPNEIFNSLWNVGQTIGGEERYADNHPFADENAMTHGVSRLSSYLDFANLSDPQV